MTAYHLIPDGSTGEIAVQIVYPEGAAETVVFPNREAANAWIAAKIAEMEKQRHQGDKGLADTRAPYYNTRLKGSG
ncbi:MAG TPA: hypothetical protein VNY05_39135 [Candidatus Acidoferrales bacterium]|jgi:hypothetical protein|nr:hypothetical protein [Candidatus Acidoferrales bacterium]